MQTENTTFWNLKKQKMQIVNLKSSNIYIFTPKIQTVPKLQILPKFQKHF